MAILKKTLFPENLDRYGVYVNDTELNSKYFKITELSDTFTGGKNAFLIQGSEYLVSDTLIKIEIKDAQGNIIYHEPGEGIPEYFEGTSKVVAVYIYPDTSFGPCTITILGELSKYDNNGLETPIPLDWEGKYNVKWQRQINVNPLLANTTKVRFYRRPKVDITESILPIYNRTVTTKTISGSINATPISPSEGSDYRTFKGILQYELSATASIFSQSMEGETITINGLSNTYSPTISDVTTDKKAYVNIPYYETSSLAPNYYSTTGFTNQPFTLSFEEQVTLTNSNVSSSFARIKITDLETFSGDANRIKVYASSKNDLGDYQLLEDITLESNELLQVDEFLNELNVRTGLFSQQVLNSFWLSTNESSTLTKTIDNSVLIKSVKLQPANEASSSTGLYRFYTSQSLDFSKNTEYQLDFTPLLSSSFGYGKIEVYATGSAFVNTDNSTTYGKLISELETNTTFRKYDKQQLNFKPDNDGTGQLMFVGKGGTWQLSNISLRAAQESAFSPNEITLVANVPTKINNEAFDFRFELYDINNNYVPVTIEKTFTFTGGNDLAVQRDLQLTVSNTAFNFNTSSQFPASIQIDFSKTGLTGDVTFQSQAFDTTGQLIAGTPYPGLLQYVDTDTRKLNIEEFTGSLSGVTVGAITYTASCEDIRRYFTIFRIEQGAPSYLFYATADKNNFTFDPDERYKSVVTDDYIDIRLVQQNLPALTPLGLKIYSGSEAGIGYDPPALRNMGSIGNATIYRLYVSESVDNPIPTNNYNFGLGQSHYDFELNTVDGKFTSSVLIDAIEKGDKGKGLFASADKNQFFYKMTDLAPTPASQTITILVKRQNLGSITNTISVTKSGSGPDLTYVGTAFGVATYTLTAGQSTNYQYGNGTTKYTFTAYDLNGVSYSDEITIAPVISESQISVNLSNENASVPAWSNGFVESGSFILTSGSVSLKVGGEDIIFDDDVDGMANNTYAVLSLTGTNCTPNGGQASNPTNLIYGITTLTKDSGSLDIVVRYKDGRGTNTDVSKSVTYTKNKKAAPVLQITSTPKAQSVSAKSTGAQIDSFSNATISVSEVYNGVTTSKTITSLTAASSDISSISTTPSTGLVTLNDKTLADGTNATNITITAQVVDSEGTTRTIYDTLSLSKVKKAPPTITFAITPSSQTVAANSAGTLTGTIVDPVLTAFEGSSALTYNQGTLSSSQYKITNVTGVTVASTTPNTSTIDVTGISSTDNTGVITISYVDSEGTSGTSTIKFTISKAIAGVQGDPGAGGADGKRTATGMVHYQLNSSSAPSTPSATSYTFSNGTFSSLTANWGTGAPTYASGNSNKYWYATYSVVETTAGGGTGTPTFGTPTQAIGFSGLVSFSGASGVSDGTNALSFGVAGTTLINGSNISTGKIISTNYSAGTPFTTAGSIIDLDNGRIATKTFYVDANGDAVFKGQIQVGGSNYNTSDVLNSNTTATQVGLGNVSNLTPQNQAQTGLIAGTTITGGGITLSSGGVIKGGQTDYDTGTGFWIGYTASKYKFSIGDSAGSKLTWDGTNLGVTGTITIKNPSTANNGNPVGQFTNGDALTAGTIGGVTIAPTKIYIGTGTYGATNTAFYVDNTGQFSLKNKLTWDGTTLSIAGNIDITGGGAATQILNAASSGSNAQTTANTAVSNASTAQSTANTAVTNAATAQTTADNAATAASNAQTSANTALDRGVTAAGKIQFAPTPSGTGLFLTSTKLGFYDGGSWKTYMTNAGNFYLSGTGNNALSWDGTTLTIDGAITARSGYIGSGTSGWTINSTNISSTNGQTVLNANGIIQLKNGSGVEKVKLTYNNLNPNTYSNIIQTYSDIQTDIPYTAFAGSNQYYLNSTDQYNGAQQTTSAFIAPGTGIPTFVFNYPNHYAFNLYGTQNLLGYITNNTNKVAQGSGWARFEFRLIAADGVTQKGSTVYRTFYDAPAFSIPVGQTVQVPGYLAGGISVQFSDASVSTGETVYIKVILTQQVSAYAYYSGGYVTGNLISMVYSPGAFQFTSIDMVSISEILEVGINGLSVGSSDGQYAAIGTVAGSPYVGKFLGNVIISGTTVATLSSSSDIRLKTNILPIKNSINKIKALNPVDFDWNKSLNEYELRDRGYGFIAQEVEQVFPELVHTSQIGILKDAKSLDYTSLHGIEVAAIQELISKMETLENKITELETKISGSI